MSKKLLRSGTSVGAMVREAEHAETNYLTKQQFESMNADAEELIKLVTAILKSTKANLKN